MRKLCGELGLLGQEVSLSSFLTVCWLWEEIGMFLHKQDILIEVWKEFG